VGSGCTEKGPYERVSADSRTRGDDAVAFTAGYQGAPFSAGVLHAWLAADRERPIVAIGISMGTFAAAAMRRAYEELEHAKIISSFSQPSKFFLRCRVPFLFPVRPMCRDVFNFARRIRI